MQPDNRILHGNEDIETLRDQIMYFCGVCWNIVRDQP
jgi:hypothetical protein